MHARILDAYSIEERFCILKTINNKSYLFYIKYQLLEIMYPKVLEKLYTKAARLTAGQCTVTRF